jgi:hypothetical protein
VTTTSQPALDFPRRAVPARCHLRRSAHRHRRRHQLHRSDRDPPARPRTTSPLPPPGTTRETQLDEQRVNREVTVPSGFFIAYEFTTAVHRRYRTSRIVSFRWKPALGYQRPRRSSPRHCGTWRLCPEIGRAPLELDSRTVLPFSWQLVHPRKPPGATALRLLENVKARLWLTATGSTATRTGPATVHQGPQAGNALLSEPIIIGG